MPGRRLEYKTWWRRVIDLRRNFATNHFIRIRTYIRIRHVSMKVKYSINSWYSKFPEVKFYLKSNSRQATRIQVIFRSYKEWIVDWIFLSEIQEWIWSIIMRTNSLSIKLFLSLIKWTGMFTKRWKRFDKKRYSETKTNIISQKSQISNSFWSSEMLTCMESEIHPKYEQSIDSYDSEWQYFHSLFEWIFTRFKWDFTLGNLVYRHNSPQSM